MSDRTESGVLLRRFRRLSLPIRLLLTLVTWGAIAATISIVSLVTGRLSLHFPLLAAVVAFNLAWVIWDHCHRRWRSHG